MSNAITGVSTAGEYVALPEGLLDVYSMDIMHTAQGIMRYEEFAVMKTELTAVSGQTVQFTSYANITRGGQLTENVPMETRAMSASQASITVTEWGNAIGVSEKLLQLSWDDQLAEAAVLLGRDYAVVRDLALRDTLVASGDTLFTTPAAAALGDVDPADTFDVETIRNGVEALMTANAPKFLNDYFICFIHPHQAAYIQRDPDWVAAQNYAGTRKLFTGEIGRWQDVIFISTTHQGNGAAGATDPGYEAALVAAGSAGQNLYRATLFADAALAIVDALPVEMRDDGVRDFGREHALAWYSIFGSGILDSNYVQHIISS